MFSCVRYRYFNSDPRFLESSGRCCLPMNVQLMPTHQPKFLPILMVHFQNIVTKWEYRFAGALLFSLTVKHFGFSTFFSSCLVLHEPMWINLIFRAVKPAGTKTRKLLRNTGFSSVVKQSTFVKSDMTQVYITNLIALTCMLHVSISTWTIFRHSIYGLVLICLKMA